MNLRTVNKFPHVVVKMAAKSASDRYGSETLEQESLSPLTVEQLRERLAEKGLPTTGKKKVLLERLVNAEYVLPTSGDVKSELHETSNFTEVTKESLKPENEELAQEISCIRRKAKTLQMDMNDLIRDIVELSQTANNKIKVQIRIERLTQYREGYLQLRNELIDLIAEENIEEELHRWKGLLDAVDKAVDLAHECLNRESKVEEKSSKESTHNESRQSSNLKLPRIELPKFNGEVLKFQNFWDQFEAAVHTNDDLPNVQKFTYLRSVLTGNALQTIEGFEVTGANYQPAVECLKHRYGRKRVIISSLVKSIIKMDSKSSVNASSLRDLYDTLKNRTRALEALGENPMSHGCILLPMFESKLPPQLLEKWELELADTPEEEIDVDVFFKFLNRQVVSKEAGERGLHTNANPNDRSSGRVKHESRKSVHPYRSERVSTASALFSEAQPSSNASCSFCQADHGSPNCPVFNGKSVDERWKLVQESKLCYNCLKPSHHKHFSKICRQPKCSVANCGRRHHKLLHGQPPVTTPQYPVTSLLQHLPSTSPQHLTDSTHSGLASTHPTSSVKETLLQTAVARLSVNGQETTVRVLLDSGSQRSYIRKNITESIGLQGPTELLSVTTLGGETSETKRLQRVQFSLLPIKGEPTEAVEMEALTIPKICNPLGPVKLNLQNNPHLQGLTLADSYPRNSVQVDVLIGADYYYSFVTGVHKRGPTADSLIAVKSHFGWILTGAIDRSSRYTTSMLTVVENNEVIASLKRFWDLESIGITEAEDAVMSQEEEYAVAEFNKGLKFDGQNYEVQLPWKKDHPRLKNNYAQAVKRLESIERRLKRDPVKAEAYSTAINQYVEKGFAEEVPEQEIEPGIVQYLPHHAVFRTDKKTSKCRIVFDASTREEGGVSLNDCVLPGPALQPNLTSVLIRFRTHRVGLIADVEKMFLQVKLSPKDQDVHRYLWRDLLVNEPIKVYRMQRLTFGVNSSPFLAIATVHNHANKYAETFPDATREILQNMYVDDCLTGADTDVSALKLQQEMSEIMMTAAFNLTKWASNSEFVMDGIDPAKRASSSLVEFDSSDPLKALGVSWDLTTDCFRFLASNSIISCHDPMTKRSVLSLASKVFDPMGLISPFTVRAKILFQELWQKGLQWDDPLDGYTGERWSSWKSDLLQLKDVTVPRCFGNGITPDSRIELHGFGDASPKAYGAAVYIRVTDEQGQISSQLVMSRSRVAPIKTVSLPRLELLAAVVNARLLKFVVQTLPIKIDNIVCWTDSMVALHWIRGQSSCWKPFVANRVVEIQSTWDPECWRYCPSKENPADLLTRGLTCGDMSSSTLWWNGPRWLLHPYESQPIQPRSEDTVHEACEEERRITHGCTAVSVEPLMDMLRYGTWMKLIRVTAYVLRAVKLFKTRSKSKETELSTEEMKQAELKCCMWIQEEVYKEDYQQLKAGRALPSSSRLLKLDPYYDIEDQVIRVGGRLQFADLPEENKHQIILPHGHPAVAKLIQDVHKQMLHAGPETVLSVIRQKIWLTQGRREAKRVIRTCVPCQRQRVGPSTQKMGPLPEERVSTSLPFTHIGTDFAGPLYVKDGSSVKKAYVCVFTCASSRMVHLELTNGLTTDEFLQAFSRMTNRRGLCRTVWSDNAKAFKAASREIKKLYDQPKSQSQSLWDTLNQDRIKSELSSKGIKWRFITERSPWRGGWWERFCRAVKEPLRKVLGRALLTFNELNTLLIKIEGVINSRPLTAVSDDNRDPLPITPAHLAIGRSLNQLPDAENDKLEESSKRIMERYLYLQRLLNHYWKRWRQEYLYQLTVRNKWQKETPPIQVGDIVLVSEDNISRGKWPLARVEKVHPGRDGLVRTATVRVEKSTLIRPVQRLHRLEIESAAPQASHKEDVLLHGGEKSQSNVVPAQSVIVPESKLEVVHPDGGQGGEDVTARRSRTGRVIRKPDKLNL